MSPSLNVRIIGFVVALSVAAVGVFGALLVYAMEQRASRRERLREQFAEALADLYRWAELPYRVRRRPPDDDARYKIADSISNLQERLRYHSAWLQVEARGVHRAFVELEKMVREQVAKPLKQAWDSAPVSTDAGMSIGNLGVEISDAALAYTEAVRANLRWYVVAFWR